MRSAIFALVLFVSLPLMAQFKFQPVDIPGAVETQVRGINNSGGIVGFYRVAAGECIPFATPSVQVPACDEHGFKIVNGVLTKIDVPGSLSTAIMGINDAGDMVGYYTKTSEACIIEQHAFLWSRRNVIQEFDYSDSTGFCGTDALWTVPFGINNEGTVAGTVWSVLDGQPSGGFVYRDGKFRAVNPNGLEGGCFTCTSVAGISSRGVVVGTVYRVFGLIPMWGGFMKRGTDEAFFSPWQDDNWITGVNAVGDVVGYGIYGAGFFVKQLSRELGGNAVSVHSTPTSVGYPDAVGTFPFAVNNRRIVVGAYMAVDGTLHGFMATPAF